MAFGDGLQPKSAGTSTGFTTVKKSGFATFNRFGKQADINTSEGLLNLAKMQGGAIAESAEDIVHPRKSLLSRISTGFKESFSTFVDIISTPSEIVAGLLDPDTTVSQAIKENLKPSDVFFGESDKDDTALQKVGNFFVRTATDILLDPLTYVTFGASRGIFGLTAAAKVPVIGEAGGVKVFKALSKEGEELLSRGIQLQKQGLARSAEITGKARGLAGEELDNFVKSTIDAELDPDFVRQSLGAMFSNPNTAHLAEKMLDKGGVKFFGQTILSGKGRRNPRG